MGNRLHSGDNYTMDDIAKELNVSKATISRAISGKGRIGKETKERILHFIKETGYKPNATARCLASSKTYNIGVVVPYMASYAEAPFFKDCLLGVTEAAVKNEYDTVLAILPRGDLVPLRRIVEDKKVDGLVLTRVAPPEVSLYLKNRGMPFILIGTDEDKNNLQIDSKQQEACKSLISNILNKSFTKIAFFADSEDLEIEQTRYKGYELAFEEKNLELNKSLIFFDAKKNIEQCLTLALKKKVDCIACSDDLICAEVLELLEKRNICIPNDVQVVSFFDSEKLENNAPSITAVHIDAKAMCFQAGKLLIDYINGEDVKKVNFTECSVVFRASSL